MRVNPEEIGKRVKLLRKEHGYSQIELAEHLNVDRTYIWKLENGKNMASIDLLAEIVDIFEVSLDYLVFGKIEYGSQKSREEIKECVRSLISSLELFQKEI